eukprot:jgi/Hompol1/5779/HPOL_004687-RA
MDTFERDENEEYLDESEVAQIVEEEENAGEPMSEDDENDEHAMDGEDAYDDGDGAENDYNGDGIGAEESSTAAQGQLHFVDDSVQGFFEHKEPVYAVALHPIDATLAATGGGDDRSYLWRIDTGDKVYDLGVHSDSVVAIQFSSDGQFVASGGMDGKVIVHRIADGQLIQTLEGPSEVTWIDWHPKGNVLLCGGEDGSVWMWQLPSGNCMNVFTGHVESVTCGQFTPDGKMIVTGSSDGSVILWDPKTATALQRWTSDDSRFHQTAVTSLSVSKDSSLILSGAQDGTVRLLHSSNGRILASFDDHQDSVEATGFSDTLPYAATGSVDGKVNVWDITGLRLRHSLLHDDAVTKLKWHTASPLLTTSSMDWSVRCWDSRTGEMTQKWQGHQAAVLDIAVRRDGHIVLSGSDDGTALVFSA